MWAIHSIFLIAQKHGRCNAAENKRCRQNGNNWWKAIYWKHMVWFSMTVMQKSIWWYSDGSPFGHAPETIFRGMSEKQVCIQIAECTGVHPIMFILLSWTMRTQIAERETYSYIAFSDTLTCKSFVDQYKMHFTKNNIQFSRLQPRSPEIPSHKTRNIFHANQVQKDEKFLTGAVPAKKDTLISSSRFMTWY